MDTNDVLRRMLAAADILRELSVQDGARTFAYRKSTQGLAALIEAWCVDHAAWETPEVIQRLPAGERHMDQVVLRALRNALAQEDARDGMMRSDDGAPLGPAS